MKTYFYLWLALFAMISSSIAHAQTKSNITLYNVRFANGTSEIFSITEKTALKVPEWSPDKSGAPPLAIDRATALAKEWIKKKDPKSKGFDVSSIKMSRIVWPGIENKWFYLFDFEHMIEGYGSTGADLFVVILMDGTIVSSVKNP
jgi:hypothetical protein